MYYGRKSWSMERYQGPDRPIDLHKLRVEIDKALTKRNEKRWIADDLLLLIVQGKMQVFIDQLGIVLTEIVVTRDKRLLVFLLGGERINEWKARMNERLKAYAKEMGCVCLETWARLDAERPLKELGWSKEQVVMRQWL